MGAPARREFQIFACDAEEILNSRVQALRGQADALKSLPDLREDHHRLVNSAESDAARYGLVNQETDRMTNSLDTLAEQVAHWMKLRIAAQTTVR